ncbi:MAG TPA: hypothetical protein PLL20_10345 [Phycisphaerae bacterium]|nr:hypothetical protein [Phycisphaerae bacterium]HRR84972.1 hypothetical protein [Phycisphaerae bacterium]
MKKAMVFVLLAMAAPALAGNLNLADAKAWGAPWGQAATVSDQGNGVFNLSIGYGSAGVFWRLPAFPSEIVRITGTWTGDCGGAGWAEVMMFTSTEGMSDAEIANRIDTGNAADIVAKHDSWGLNGGPAWPWQAIEAAPMTPPGGKYEIHATCAEVVVALKVGQVGQPGTWATYDLTFIPEPAAALLLGLPLMLLRRRR